VARRHCRLSVGVGAGRTRVGGLRHRACVVQGLPSDPSRIPEAPLGGNVDLKAIRREYAERSTIVDPDSVGCYTFAIFESRRYKTRVNEEVTPLRRVLRQKVSISVDLSEIPKDEDLLLPVLVPLKKPCSDNRHARGADTGHVGRWRAWSVRDRAAELEQLAKKGGDSLTLLAVLLRKLADHYVVVQHPAVHELLTLRNISLSLKRRRHLVLARDAVVAGHVEVFDQDVCETPHRCPRHHRCSPSGLTLRASCHLPRGSVDYPASPLHVVSRQTRAHADDSAVRRCRRAGVTACVSWQRIGRRTSSESCTPGDPVPRWCS
jgi:hypothetical protein